MGDRFLVAALLELGRGAAASPHADLITTNFMRFFKPLDYWKWAEREDVVSDDVYQDPSDPEAGMRSAMAGDLMRSLGRGRPWVLMEQTTSRVNWRDVNVAKAPGQMRLWSYQAVARGADGVMFFQWRQSRAGAEKFHSAMVPHGPVMSSPVWKEAKQLGQELRGLDAVCGSRVRADAAIVLDWESWWALELPSKPSIRVRQEAQLEDYYRPLFSANIVADFARPQDDLSGYRLVLVPNLYLVGDEGAASLTTYVKGGGNVSELIEPSGAEVLASFAGSRVDRRPAVTRHKFGSGSAYYVGTRLDQPSMGRLLLTICAEAGVEPALEAPAGVEAVRRSFGHRSILFLLNHRHSTVDVPLSQAGTNLVDGSQVHAGLFKLGPYGAAVIREGW